MNFEGFFPIEKPIRLSDGVYLIAHILFILLKIDSIFHFSSDPNIQRKDQLPLILLCIKN